MQDKPKPRRAANRGSFKPGPDPRRHQFTPEECSRGFWTAISVLGVGIGAKLHGAARTTVEDEARPMEWDERDGARPGRGTA